MDTRREPTLAQTEDARFVAKLRADPLSVVTSQPLISKYHQNTAPFHQRLVWHGSFPNKICYRFEPCLSGSGYLFHGISPSNHHNTFISKNKPTGHFFSWFVPHHQAQLRPNRAKNQGRVLWYESASFQISQPISSWEEFWSQAGNLSTWQISCWCDHCSSSWIKPLLIGGCCYALQYFTIKWGGQKTRSRGQIS